jgi:pSer/pThr/pTyr-binding forkhead associated (FHA) protein
MMTEDNGMLAQEIELETNLFDETIASRPTDLEDLDTRSITEILMRQAPQPRRVGYGIRLYLPATRDPIEIWNEPSVTLGRRDNRHQVFPTIDLTDHYAGQLGVSRLHAQISFKEACFYVTDLGSKNGTWVNKKLLLSGECEPLGHRDTLRLGHLIILIGACQYS